MEVTSEMEIDLLHWDHLSISTAGCTTFHTETRTKRWLTKCYNGILADLVKSECKSDRHRCLTDSGLGRRDCSHKDQLALIDLFLVHKLS